MRRSTLLALLGCMMLTAACATPRPNLPAAPLVEMPAEALRPCSLYVLPAAPKTSDLEIGYAVRGSQLAACELARNLAVQTFLAEFALRRQATQTRNAAP